jgi:PAS domain S-box-containing protein
VNGLRRHGDGESWRDQLPHVLSDLGVGLVVGTPERAIVVNEAFCTMTGYSTKEALAMRPFVGIFAPEARDAVLERALPQLNGDDAAPTCYETEILSLDGRRVPVAVSAQVALRGGQREVVATFRDLTDDRRAEAELAVRARQQEVVAELGRHALVQRDPASLLDAAVLAVGRTLGTDYVEVLELRPERDAFVLRAGMGWGAGLVGELTFPAGRSSPAGMALESNGPVVVANTPKTCVTGPEPLSAQGVVAGAFVLIRGVHQPYGVLGVETVDPREFSRDDVHFLRAIANVLADAIGQARVEAALRSAHERDRRLRQRLEMHSRRVVKAQESERRRIARELHDEIGQSLTALKLALEDHDRLPREEVATRVARAGELTGELLRYVHDLSLDLRPAVLDDLGLWPALLWLVERYSAQTGVEVALSCSGLEEPLDPEVEIAAYRIVQEGLTNVARHADAGRAAVKCEVVRSALHVEVVDDGAGFDIDALPIARRSGLVGMEERARAMGGQLCVRSKRGQGTTIVAHLPICASERPTP